MNLGLGYESSSDEDTAPVAPIAPVAPVAKPQKPVVDDAPATVPTPQAPQAPASLPSPTSTIPGPSPSAQPPPSPPSVPEGPISGPSLGPSASPPRSTSEDAAPASPYTTTRTLIRNLTLPTTPNFDIPPSPPGSPPLRATTKFTQFLALKAKGQHFNQRLESSSVLKDPAHLARLMEFAGLSEQDMYASTLPDGVAVPTTFPRGAYFEDLRESQKRLTKAKEEENKRNPREGIEFVSAVGTPAPSGTSTPSAKAPRQSASERAMSGLDRPMLGKRKELEQRWGRSESSRWASRSPKRKRDGEGERR